MPGRRRVYEPKQNPQHLVYVRWHDKENGPISSFYGPFANPADAAGFSEEFTRQHRGVVEDARIEPVIPVEPLEFFEV
jgi:hypothetical protein